MPVICDSCGESSATIFFKADIDGRQTKMNLCEDCARQQGVLSSWGALGGGIELSNILGSLAQDFHEGLAKTYKAPARPPSSRCPRCGVTFTQFRSTGFVGCAQCYESFMPAMKEVIRRIHGSAVHKGKESPKLEIARLRRELDQALAREDFERAAVLRDKIRKLESN